MSLTESKSCWSSPCVITTSALAKLSNKKGGPFTMVSLEQNWSLHQGANDIRRYLLRSAKAGTKSIIFKRFGLWQKGHLTGTLPWLLRMFLTQRIIYRKFGVKTLLHLTRYSSTSHCGTINRYWFPVLPINYEDPTGKYKDPIFTKIQTQ